MGRKKNKLYPDEYKKRVQGMNHTLKLRDKVEYIATIYSRESKYKRWRPSCRFDRIEEESDKIFAETKAQLAKYVNERKTAETERGSHLLGKLLRFFSKDELQTILAICNNHPNYMEYTTDLLNPYKFPPLNSITEPAEELPPSESEKPPESFKQRELNHTDDSRLHKFGRAVSLGLPKADGRMKRPEEGEIRPIILSEATSWVKTKKGGRKDQIKYLFVQTFDSLLEQNDHFKKLQENIKAVRDDQTIQFRFHYNRKIRYLLGGQVAPDVIKHVIKLFEPLLFITRERQTQEKDKDSEIDSESSEEESDAEDNSDENSMPMLTDMETNKASMERTRLWLLDNEPPNLNSIHNSNHDESANEHEEQDSPSQSNTSTPQLWKEVDPKLRAKLLSGTLPGAEPTSSRPYAKKAVNLFDSDDSQKTTLQKDDETAGRHEPNSYPTTQQQNELVNVNTEKSKNTTTTTDETADEERRTEKEDENIDETKGHPEEDETVENHPQDGPVDERPEKNSNVQPHTDTTTIDAQRSGTTKKDEQSAAVQRSNSKYSEVAVANKTNNNESFCAEYDGDQKSTSQNVESTNLPKLQKDADNIIEEGTEKTNNALQEKNITTANDAQISGTSNKDEQGAVVQTTIAPAISKSKSSTDEVENKTKNDGDFGAETVADQKSTSHRVEPTNHPERPEDAKRIEEGTENTNNALQEKTATTRNGAQNSGASKKDELSTVVQTSIAPANSKSKSSDDEVANKTKNGADFGAETDAGQKTTTSHRDEPTNHPERPEDAKRIEEGTEKTNNALQEKTATTGNGAQNSGASKKDEQSTVVQTRLAPAINKSKSFDDEVAKKTKNDGDFGAETDADKKSTSHRDEPTNHPERPEEAENTIEQDVGYTNDSLQAGNKTANETSKQTVTQPISTPKSDSSTDEDDSYEIAKRSREVWKKTVTGSSYNDRNVKHIKLSDANRRKKDRENDRARTKADKEKIERRQKNKKQLRRQP
ncbi:Oidioi.mRNA.OKI2018_I69.chr2.g4878.t1.cds [Oikopleura dioica]|uniref:Oidioi.mRNA.OKI2018_I69.chr2.g4878.t1.cds n=1 Tax=Oikopleura dioica TaxID=34765 RepID=A0ABN7T4E2_OIKDI|nr:Oidioi.mRNA.OKI2018_I69.chr2.g4878.t1.cds [Oikopleura dioica]